MARHSRHPGIRKRLRSGGRVSYEVPYGAAWTRSKSFPTLEEAKTFQAKVVLNQVPSGRVKLSDYFDTFMELLPSSTEPKTRFLYQRQFDRYIRAELGEYKLDRITPMLLKRYFLALQRRDFRGGDGRATISQVYRILHRLFALAVEEKMLESNPCTSSVRDVAGKPGERRVRILHTSEVLSLARHMDLRYRASVFVMGYLGLRVGEMLGLQVGDIDFEERTLRIERAVKDVNGQIYVGSTKTDRPREIPLPGFVADELRALIAKRQEKRIRLLPEAILFAAPWGGWYGSNNYRARIFDKAVQGAGLDPAPSPHDLRHSAATLLVEAGVKDYLRMAILGHSALAMTYRYTHVTPEMLEEARGQMEAYFRREA